MSKLLIILLVFFVTGFCIGCSNKRGKPSKNEIPVGDTIHSELKFSAGDIIACDMDHIYPASHIFIALPGKYVIHVTGPKDGSMSNETFIEEDLFSRAGNPFKYCKVITEFYDKKYADTCGGKPFNTSEIIRRADKSRTDLREKVTHYDVYRCNCEHWVSAWRYGVAMTVQPPKLMYSIYKSDKCQAPGIQRCP